MSDILIKFTNHERILPFSEAIDAQMRALGFPQHVREDAAAWVAQADSQYRIPEFDLSYELPAGLTNEQAEQIRREIHREFTRFGEVIRAAKYDYLIEQINTKLSERLRSA